MRSESFLIEGFSGSKHEKLYLKEQLNPFYSDGWIRRVLFTVKRGKEAAVYCCEGHPDCGHKLLAAKVYHPRKRRAMQNYALYQEGRGHYSENGGTFLKERERRAVANNTSFGRQIGTYNWTSHEYHSLKTLWDMGVRVPQPMEMSSHVILMEYFGDNRLGAPALNEIRLDLKEAEAAFTLCLEYIGLMLEYYLIHGDLSAYNILYWDEEPVFIDFPQVVDPMANPCAYSIFSRDVTRVCEYFNACGMRLDAAEIAMSLWEERIDSQEGIPELVL